jgi:uncharacterized protein (TIGR02466 family)|tara:strand:+ start:123 stop:710 length:588 start_codon:yes stop_codon:yes gene_type:complete
MVDVKIHKCFPTIIYEWDYEASDIVMMESWIRQVQKNHKYHTKDDLHQLSYFMHLREKIYEVTKQYLEDLQYEYDKLEITGMWANKLYEGDSHPPHTHSNNFLSGVYYLTAGKKASPIQFFDPRPQSQVLRPRNKANWNNASMVQFSAIQGKGFIFPSWLQHWVPPTGDERISISWNIIVRGNYGEPDTLQNAYI